MIAYDAFSIDLAKWILFREKDAILVQPIMIYCCVLCYCVQYYAAL